MGNTVLVVAAHPDDEALGCGGTIARHVSDGDVAHLILMGDGVSSRAGSGALDIEHRRAAARECSSILGFSSVHHFAFPDNRMDEIPLLECAQALAPIIRRLSPQVVYTHYFGDLNVDHRRTQEAVMVACRPQPGMPVREIYGFEVLSSTEWCLDGSRPFRPNTYVDISAYLQRKMLAVASYDEEMRAVPHTRSVRHVELLARHRGYEVGLEAAEAFVSYRRIR